VGNSNQPLPHQTEFLILDAAVDPSFFNNNQPRSQHRLFWRQRLHRVTTGCILNQQAVGISVSLPRMAIFTIMRLRNHLIFVKKILKRQASTLANTTSRGLETRENK